MHSPIHNDISCSCPSPFPSLTGRYQLSTDSRCSGRAESFFGPWRKEKKKKKEEEEARVKTVMSASPASFQQLQPRQRRAAFTAYTSGTDVEKTHKKKPQPTRFYISNYRCSLWRRARAAVMFCSDNTHCLCVASSTMTAAMMEATAHDASATLTNKDAAVSSSEESFCSIKAPQDFITKYK